MSLFEKLNNKKVIILLFLFMFIGITLIFTQYFGLFPLNDEYALDMLNYYSKTLFFNSIESMDQPSRLSYFMIHLGDYLFMFGFYQLLGLAIFKLINRKSKLIYLATIPYFAFLFDFLENIIMDIHLAIYPNQIEVFGYVAGISTFMKFISMYVSLLLILLLFIYKHVIRYRKKDFI